MALWAHYHRDREEERVAKRLLDLLAAGLLLTASAPLLALIALLIRLETSGPAIYRSPRLGRAGRPFGLLRFRTVDPAVPADRSLDARLSRVGRFFRNYSLDDLPNLVNVLRGELSLVGPRPMEPDALDPAHPLWQRVLSVRPGMVSPAVLALGARYNAAPLSLRRQLEFDYIARRSLALDLRLLGRGARALVASRGNVKARGRPTPAGAWALNHTWDGQPISAERPRGAMIVVYRRTAAGLEFLLLHRAHHGPAFAGDWAWSPPSGARRPGESLEACAVSELAEEAGLRLLLRETAYGGDEWATFAAEAGPGVAVRLDAEHDRFEWLPTAEALARCRPEQVARPISLLAARLQEA
jgi:lipopolysaccharide/colanic/teichoic acid biosynthesis glycosyltransferase/8-oxo-dGTP pyrophosphatase MutT (NUDIX family)